MQSIEDMKVAKALELLRRLDGKMNELIMEVQIEKDLEDGRTNTRDQNAVINTNAMRSFIETINAIRIEGNEDILVKINDKYDKAIELLNESIQQGDPYYAEQLRNELKRLEINKSERYDSIAETYKEIARRLERGEIQQDYFQMKADEKQGEITAKEREYKSKCGNIDSINATLKEPYRKLKIKYQVGELYKKLKEYNAKISRIELRIKTENLSEEEKQRLIEECERLKEERKNDVQTFVGIAKDKDGKKYEKAEDKSDEEYINEIDPQRIEDAIKYEMFSFKNVFASVKPEDREFVMLDKKLQEVQGTNDIADFINLNVNKFEDAQKVMDMLDEQKRLWMSKQKEDGYDKAKLEYQRDAYKEKGSNYTNSIQENNEGSTGGLPSVDNDIKYRDRYEFNRQKYGRIRSFFRSIFKKQETEEEMVNKIYSSNTSQDVSQAKKKALEYLTENTKGLNKLDKKSKDFKKELEYNVKATEGELKKFWDDQERNRER